MVVGACDAPATVLPVLPRAQVDVSDSMGAWVASNTGGAWSQADAWGLGADPVLRLGEASGSDHEMFYGLRDASRGPDGRIAVTNAGTYEVRIYSPRGRHIRSFGRQGDGPGEFQSVVRVEWLGSDSLLVWDQGSGRTYVFDDEGALARSVALSGDRPPMRTTGPRTDPRVSASIDSYRQGNVVARAGIWYEEVDSEEWFTAYTELVELNGAGQVVHSFGAFPLKDSYLAEQGEQPVHFGAEGGFAAHGDRVYVMHGGSPTIRVYLRTGGLLGIMRAELPPKTVDDSDVSALKREAMERVGRSYEGSAGATDMWREILDAIPSRDSMPVFSNLLTDTVGNVWVELFRPPGQEHPGWYVFRQDGQLLGRVAVPPMERIFEIGETWILGLITDENDVEQLVQYELHKPGST